MLFLAAALALTPQANTANLAPGSLVGGEGSNPILCPLKNTSVVADISGFASRVTVTQTFTNPSSTPIEAVYTFPLPADSAVDRMTMKIGDRVITGVIKRREEALAIYNAARNAGKSAALLNQERPNIFTQSVANILPKAQVQIEISYVQLLKYKEGQFEFTFPMVVGPRFLGNAKDPAEITAQNLPSGVRSGSNIDLKVNLDAGSPIVEMNSVLHKIKTKEIDQRHRVVQLAKQDEIPNRDFILRYQTATNTVQSALLAKYDPVKGGYYSLVLLPPKVPTDQQIAPKQVIFVIDQSGSQNGFPIEKSKELTSKLIKSLNPGDTFNVLGFSNNVNPLWAQPVANSAPNVQKALNFVSSLKANGGTQLRAAVEAALAQQDDPQRVKLVIFNTDGFVGDEKDILHSIREHRKNSRMFTFGIGNSVNRYLIDAMSFDGRGDSEVVTLNANADDAVRRFIARTQNPVLTDVHVEIEGVQTSEQFPSALPDVFGDTPITVYGRYDTPGPAKVKISGMMAGKPWSQTVDAFFPSDKPGGESIPTLWARQKVDKLERDYNLGTDSERLPQEGKNQIIDLSLEYGLMTQFTSFVAVEERVVNIGGKQRRVHVPVEMPDGVNPVPTSPQYVTFAAASPSLMRAGNPGGFGGAGGAKSGGVGGFSSKQSDHEERTQDQALRPKPAEKIENSLRTAKGSVEVMVWLHDLQPATLTKLKELGFKVAESDKGLVLLIGSCPASVLEKIASLEQVRRIEPLK